MTRPKFSTNLKYMFGSVLYNLESKLVFVSVSTSALITKILLALDDALNWFANRNARPLSLSGGSKYKLL